VSDALNADVVVVGSGVAGSLIAWRLADAGGLGNVIGATSIGGRRSDFFTARKLAPGNLGLLQQYLHKASH
jgi:flavin-dependent dehydrogenase